MVEKRSRATGRSCVAISVVAAIALTESPPLVRQCGPFGRSRTWVVAVVAVEAVGGRPPAEAVKKLGSQRSCHIWAVSLLALAPWTAFCQT